MAFFRCKSLGSPPEPQHNYYAKFTGKDFITLPFNVPSAYDDYEIIIDFLYEYKDDWDMIIGNSSAGSESLWLRGGENSFSINELHSYTCDTSQRHILHYNKVNGTNKSIMLDNEIVDTYNHVSYSTKPYLTIGGTRNSLTKKFNGNFYEYKIVDTANDEVVCDIIPMEYNGDLVFRDIINEVNYTCNGMTIEEEA